MCYSVCAALVARRHTGTQRHRFSSVFMRVVPLCRMCRLFSTASMAEWAYGGQVAVQAATPLQDATVFVRRLRVVACSGCSPIFGGGEWLSGFVRLSQRPSGRPGKAHGGALRFGEPPGRRNQPRSEERRVGKEWSARGS